MAKLPNRLVIEITNLEYINTGKRKKNENNRNELR